MTRIILSGCMGKMGRVVHSLVDSDPAYEIAAGVDIASSTSGFTFPVYPSITVCEMPADAVIDFSGISSIPGLLEFGVKRQVPLVICTTGLTDGMKSDVLEASGEVAIFQSANMSLGINLIENMVKKAAKLLYGSHFDIEIIEKHHNQKIDAPSGTALLLADSINGALGGQLEYVYNRNEVRRKRSRNELGLHSLRGGTIVGDHSVVFAGIDETIELSHTALSKEIFAVGAIKAAAFIKDKGPGMYTMQDLIEEL